MKKTLWEESKREEIEKLKLSRKEFDFEYRPLSENLGFFYPLPEMKSESEFMGLSFKGFVYSIYSLNGIDYAAIMTANESINLSHTLFLVPCVSIKILKEYEKGEGLSKGPDFTLYNVDNTKTAKPIVTIDDLVQLWSRHYKTFISFKYHYRTKEECLFFTFRLEEYFNYCEPEYEFEDSADTNSHVIYVTKMYSTYHDFLGFLFINRIFYKNIEIVNPTNLKEKIKEDFENIINGFGEDPTIFFYSEPIFYY